MANQLAVVQNAAMGGIVVMAGNYIRGQINENLRQRVGEVAMDTAEAWGSAMQEVVDGGTQMYDPSMDDVEYGAEEPINNIEEMPQAVGAGTTGGVFYGPIVNNYASKKKWGRFRKHGKAGLFDTYLNVRWQSIGRYDNAGYGSFPLWMTATPNSSYSQGVQVLANNAYEMRYDQIYFPFYVFNLTALPFGRVSESTSDGVVTRANGESIPMYQLYKDLTTGQYDWRICYGMNNGAPTVAASTNSSSMLLGGVRNANTLQIQSATWCPESTNGMMIGYPGSSSGDAIFNRVPQWEHCGTNIKALFQGQNTRPNTIRTGILKFSDECSPLRQYDKEGVQTQFDRGNEDTDVQAAITAQWDKYLITKHEHPLMSIKTISQRKNFHILHFDKFTLGNDLTNNSDASAIQLRKDYAIGSLGHLKGVQDEAYGKLQSNLVLGENFGNETVDAALFNKSTEGVVFTRPVVTCTNNNISADIPFAAGGDPSASATANVPLKNLGNGAKFPIITPAVTSTLFPHRNRDRWFFIHADNFLTSINSVGTTFTFQAGSGTVLPTDFGFPGSDAAYYNSMDPRRLTKGAGPPPLSMDIVIQSKYRLRTYPDTGTGV